MFDVCTTGDTAHINTILNYCHKRVNIGAINAAVKNIDAPMLTRVWQEFEHSIDVCRVTRCAHIDYLYLSKKVSVFLWL
jgi:hypothetical protein